MSAGIASPDIQKVEPNAEKGSERFDRFVEYFRETPPAKFARQIDFKARMERLMYDPRTADTAMKVLGAGLLTASILGVFGDMPTYLALNPARFAGVDQAAIMSANFAALSGEGARSLGVQKASMGVDFVSSLLNVPVGEYLSKSLEVLPDTFIPKMKEVLISRRDMLLRSGAENHESRDNIQQAMAAFA